MKMTFGMKVPFGQVLALCLLTALGSPAFAAGADTSQQPEWRTATALTGTPKYGPGVKHFDYVNPDAPKGGMLRLATSGGFDTFNMLSPKGNTAPGINLIYESLMQPSLDELDISAAYGDIADAMRYPADYSWVEYRLNPKAKWNDGEPITVDDVIWSFEKAVEISPQQRFYYRTVKKAEKVSDDVVRFVFDGPGNRELPNIMGQLTIFPKHWWEGKGADGKPRDISKGTLEPPLGSGPYRIKDFTANRSVTYERVKDYWGKDLPARVGTNNFDEIRYDSYLDPSVLVEAFKGDQFDWRTENSAKNWATAYEFPAKNDGRVVLETFPDKARGVMQAFVPNLRREKFQDRRVREALNYAFDFESANRTVFFGQYKRINSYFAGTSLASSGLPEGKELEILNSVKDLVPPEVFTTEYKNPVGGDPTAVRSNLRKALELMQQAGYELKGRELVNAKTGKPFTIEFIAQDPAVERYVLPYAQNLKRIGITLTMRNVDTSQYINLIQNHDFDMAVLVWGESLSPGNEQREYWGSEAADRPNSANYAGIKDPGVDALIDKIVFAKDRDTLVAATHALDRVLLAHDYMVPLFYLDMDRTARWNRFGHPDKMPPFGANFPTIWWYDQALAAKTGAPK